MPHTKMTIYYVCDICKSQWSYIWQAEKCEAKGKQDPKHFQTGLIYELIKKTTPDGSGVLMCIKDIRIIDHDIELECWSTADVYVGDVDAVAGLSSLDTLESSLSIHRFGRDNDNLNDYKAVQRGTMRLSRMIEFLAGKRIKPLIWDGYNTIPLDYGFSPNTQSTIGREK